MSKELRPICSYINDREEMLNQMFSTMKEDKFRAMLPPILKGMEVEELKKFCLEELLGMSSKRIQSIVAGRELLSSSDSEDLELSASENEESASAEDSDSNSSANSLPKSRRVSRDLRTDDTLQIAISSEEMGDLLQEPRASAPTPRKNAADKLKRPHKMPEPNVKPKKSRHPQQVASVNGKGESQIATAAAQPEKTLLEMLELELRARAIRAALTHQEKINLLDNREVADTGIVIEIKEESEKAASKELVTSGTTQMSKEPANSPNEALGNNKGGAAELKTPTKDSDIEIICEEISSDEEMFNELDDEEPELVEPVIESIVISSDSEPEKPEEKQESWKERWMQKKDMSSVMKASKLITNVKRKMKQDKTDKIALAQAAQVKQAEQEKPQEITLAPPSTTIQGTVSEFNLLPPALTSLASVVEESPDKQSVAEQVNVEQPVEKLIPIEMQTAELPQDTQQIKQPIEHCENEQQITNLEQGTILHETDKTDLAQEEVEPSKPVAVIVKESIPAQATAQQSSQDVERALESVDDLQTSVNSSAVMQDAAVVTEMPASADDSLIDTQVAREQLVDEEAIKIVKRKKKGKKGDKINKSQAKKVPAESVLAATVSREHSNVVTPQLKVPRAGKVNKNVLSREEVKKAKGEKKSKGDKTKRPHAKKMQSTVSKVVIGGTSSPTTTKVSPRKRFVSSDTSVKLDAVTEPTRD